MASSNNLIRFYFIALAALFASSFLVECEATTVSLTSGPYSNSRRQTFGSRGWTTRQSQVSPALLDDVFEDENYKEVEECSVGLCSSRSTCWMNSPSSISIAIHD